MEMVIKCTLSNSYKTTNYIMTQNGNAAWSSDHPEAAETNSTENDSN